jgi:molybdopterin-binding protein
MSEGGLPIRKLIPIIAITWILSLVTTLGIVYVAPNIFPPLTTEKIADGAIIVTKLADGSVTSAKILDGSISAIDLADGSIVTIKISDNAIITAKIADESVTTAKIADNAIITVKLANESVNTEKIADGAVVTSKISDDAIITVKLADGSVNSAKILDGTIIATDLADGSIITAKIADGAITTSKIADYSVTNMKLAQYAIPVFSASKSNIISTNSLQFVDMDGMSISITLNRTSYVIILFSVNARMDLPENATAGFAVRCLIGTKQANPGEIYLVPAMSFSSSTFPPHKHDLTYGAYSFHFYEPSVSPGVYSIKIQWAVGLGTAYAFIRALTIIALPA